MTVQSVQDVKDVLKGVSDLGSVEGGLLMQRLVTSAFTGPSAIESMASIFDITELSNLLSRLFQLTLYAHMETADATSVGVMARSIANGI